MNERWKLTVCPICGHAITMGAGWNHENDCPWGMALVHMYEGDVRAMKAEARVKELEEFVDEWSARFGFLAQKTPRDSFDSIDEVACILNAERALEAFVLWLAKNAEQARGSVKMAIS